jgi:hypothetical protein
MRQAGSLAAEVPMHQKSKKKEKKKNKKKKDTRACRRRLQKALSDEMC